MSKCNNCGEEHPEEQDIEINIKKSGHVLEGKIIGNYKEIFIALVQLIEREKHIFNLFSDTTTFVSMRKLKEKFGKERMENITSLFDKFKKEIKTKEGGVENASEEKLKN